jgi:glycosyltransferase involved in cell wall biosynthesis
MMGDGRPRRLLFITWDAPEASYLQSLFLPIFAGLKTHGVETDVLQFRWGDKALTRHAAEACRAHGIGYRAAPVFRVAGGAGALASALWGRFAVRSAVRSFGSDVLMPRSLMPALATLAAGADRLGPVVFDADGLAVDERVEFAGLSPLGSTYRILRDVEAQAVRRSTSVIVRSSRAADILCDRAGPPVGRDRFHVVTNGRDETLFEPGDEASRQAVRSAIGMAATAPIIAYAGSVGAQYRFDLFGDFARAVLDRRPDARLLVLTGAPDQARAWLAQSGTGVADAAVVMAVPPDEVPRYLACADVGAAFRQPSFSMTAVAPIKLAEYLLCGLPVVGTAAIGDTSRAVETGVFLNADGQMNAAADWFVDRILPARERWRDLARGIGIDAFSLGRSVRDYRDALAPVGGIGDRTW